jgi:hypothetical protein
MVSSKDTRPRAERYASLDRSERARKAAWILAVTLVVAVILWGMRGKMFGTTSVAAIAAMCDANYAKARTASDTAVIDAQRPVPDPESAVARVSCGELRRAGSVGR